MALSALGLTLIILAAGTYLGMIFVLQRFTYRTWLFDAVIVVGLVLASVGLVIGGPSPVALTAIGLGVAWFPLTRRELTLVGATIQRGILFLSNQQRGPREGKRFVFTRE